MEVTPRISKNLFKICPVLFYYEKVDDDNDVPSSPTCQIKLNGTFNLY